MAPRRLAGGRPLAAALALLAASAAFAPHPATACSEVVLGNKTIYPAVVSARNYDFYSADLLMIDSVVAVPPGQPLTFLPVDEQCTASGFDGQPSKHGFVCMSMLRNSTIEGVTACSQANGADYLDYPGLCMDGLNDQGVSVGMFGDRGGPADFKAYDKAGAPPLFWMDVTAFLLARYGSVAELKSGLTSGVAQLVDNPMLGMQQVPPMFWSVADPTGQAVVVQMKTPGVWEVLDNPVGVVANNPALQEQYRWLEWWKGQMAEAHGPVDASVMFPGLCSLAANITNPNGTVDYACKSITHFTTLAMLKDAMYSSRESLPEVDYDAVDPRAHPDPANPAIIQSLLILNYATTPGLWPNTSFTPPDESTAVQFVRDHGQRNYYLRTMASLQWIKLQLPDILKAGQGGIREALLEELAPPTLDWSLDQTAMLQ